MSDLGTIANPTKRKITKRVIWVIIVGVLLLFLFYWFQIRPSQIRKDCNIEAYASAAVSAKEKGIGDIEKENWTINQKDYDNSYQSCLRDKGLE